MERHLIFVKVCGLFKWKRICTGFILLFVYICIAVGHPIIKRGKVEIPSATPAYGVYIHVSLSWSDITELVVPIMISLIEGCYWTKGSYWLSNHFEKFYDRHHDLVDLYVVSVSQMTSYVMFVVINNPYQKIFVSCGINTTGATCETGTTYPSSAPEFAPVLVGFVLLDLEYSL